MIPSVEEKLQNFTGQIVHSTEMDQLASPEKNAVKGMRILLIGDSSSAEDLALQSVKLGADKDTAKELAKTNQKDAIVVALEK